MFSPTSKAELEAAVEECLALPQNTYCSKGPHGAIGSWEFSLVTDLSLLFHSRVIPATKSFNGDISKWDVSRVTNMQYMFAGAALFNRDISKWDVSRVNNMEYMFTHAKSFASDISKWDVSSVTGMTSMFYNAKSFNSDLSKWDVSRVTKMQHMFYGTISFSHILCGAWRTANAEKDYMLTGSRGKICGQPADYYNLAPQREKRTTPRSFRTRGPAIVRPTRPRGPLITRGPVAGHHQSTHDPYYEHRDDVLQLEKRNAPRRRAPFRKPEPFGKPFRKPEPFRKPFGARRERGQRSPRKRWRGRHKTRVVSSTHPAPTPPTEPEYHSYYYSTHPAPTLPWRKSGFHNSYYYFSNPLSHNRVDYEVKSSVSTTSSVHLDDVDDIIQYKRDLNDRFMLGICFYLIMGYLVYLWAKFTNMRYKKKKQDTACLDTSAQSHVLNELKHAFLLSRVLNRGDTDSLVPVIGKANSAFEIVIKDNGMGDKDYYV